MMAGMSSGARAMSGRAGQVSQAVSNFGKGRGQAYGTKLVKGANLGTRRGQATAMVGSAIGNASRYAGKNPNRAMGIAAGVTGAGAYGVNRRRGSQNYPMY